MDKIVKFLEDAKPCFVATVDGDQPCVRPQGFSMVYDGKLCFCTADEKATSRELKKNPKVEIAAVNAGKFIRIRGKAVFLDESAAKHALEMRPQLEKMIHPGKFEIFAVTDGTAVIADLASGESEKIEF
ncbi:MAG: pyridoxamine 5'-phosphate oxidase family protein [Emergencia sp.]